jgi:ATP-dependent RNA helicase DOB1
MKNVIKKIIAGTDLEDIFSYVKNNIFRNGPVSITDMEILCYLKLYHSELFDHHENTILNYMSLFYKETETHTLKDLVFTEYKAFLKEKFHHTYTPVQASIIDGISGNKCFSFSAPTSTGKSYVFLKRIQATTRDIMVVVPSRALINEYYLTLSENITDKTINILTFIDKINTDTVVRSIFIVTPERARELFKRKNEFDIELFLFDEAQLSNETSKRGLYFDSIVRRSQKAYPEATFVFAHPFVKNPESQIKKNNFNVETSKSVQYLQKNVGQMFMLYENEKFYHFGIDKNILGQYKQECNFDPIIKCILSGGSVLFYVSKTQIYNQEIFKRFSKYIELCEKIETEDIEFYIEKMKEYSGGDNRLGKSRYSHLIALMERGIVIHHGSLPLQIRILIEKFTKAGLSRICLATSTLEQGINMPFDIVFLDKLEASKGLSVKNLIGRAGRSSLDDVFDFGYVVTKNMSKLREVIKQEQILDDTSLIEKDDVSLGDDYDEFKEAIIQGTYSDEYNLTEKAITKLTSNNTDTIIKLILNSIFNSNGDFISLAELRNDENDRLEVYHHFTNLYSMYLGRDLVDAEKYILNTAIKIILWRVHGKTFKNICWYRYAYASKSWERRNSNYSNITANYITKYHNDFPSKNLKPFPLNTTGHYFKANSVSYDLIMYDTYDYIDKLIGFKLSDIFYAAFDKYYQKYGDNRAKKLSKYIKYGTDDERTIWMLRYGLSFEDIEILGKHIESIAEGKITFKDSIDQVPDSEKTSIERFL